MRRTPAPERQPGGHQGRVLLLDALGVAGDPGGEDEGRAESHQGRRHGERVVARVGVRGHPQEDDQHDHGERRTDEHEGLAHLERIGEQPDDDQRDDVGRPEPRVEPVGLGHREVGAVGVLEDDRVVDGEEAGRGVVQQQEQRDAEGRADEIPLEDLAPRVLGRLQQLVLGQAACPRLDQRLVAGGHHELVPELRREILQEEERDDEDDEGGDARNDELALPVGLAEVIQRVQGHERGDETPRHRANRPKPHGRGPAELRAEVPHQCRRGHEDGAFDNTDQAGDDEVGPLIVGQRDADGGEQPDDEQPVDDNVGTPHSVRLAGRQRGECAEEVGDHDDGDVEGETHVESGQDVGRHPGLRVVHVVEDERGQHREGQVAGATRPARVLRNGVIEEEPADRSPDRRLHRQTARSNCARTHVVPPVLVPGLPITLAARLPRHCKSVEVYRCRHRC